MRLWTIQPIDVYKSWQESGVYRTDPDRVDNAFRHAYSWLTHQMHKRLPPAPPGCLLPVWAWYQARNTSKPRPDLRTSGFLQKGLPAIMLTIEIDANLVLLSDFDLWHYVLNNNYLPTNFSENEKKVSRESRELSWDKIFDLDFASPMIAESRSKKIIQATFWELTAAQVVAIQPFIAR